MNKLLINTAVVTATVLMSLSANAAVKANIGATSNYLWRGITQTNDAAAVQGGIDYNHEVGFYAGTWASNVDFSSETSYEIDFYAGFTGSIGEEFGYDISYLYYAYPDADDSIDFGEATVALSWKWIEVSYALVVNAGADVTGDPALDEKDMDYLQTTLTYPISDTLSIAAQYGYSTGDIVSAWYNTDSYADYSIALSKDTEFGTVSFMVSDTDLEDDDAKVLVGYSYSFDL